MLKLRAGKSSLPLLSLLLLLAIGSTSAKDLVVPGKTLFEHNAAQRVVIEVHTGPREPLSKTEFDEYMNYAPLHFGLSEPNEAVVKRIGVKWGGLPAMYLSSSAFGDLHDPRRVEIEMKGESLLLSIAGGDAAGSYRAQLEIAPYGIVRRWVFNQLSGHEQTAVYSYSHRYIEQVRTELERDKKPRK
ncbi:hypothetical protein [Usitatibacter palustris]|uniref:SRPBCC family protein n=1 Tax=Usitatibacter palustris TaxID=2732487 RepID=A0A6M4H3P5_9PROT|nr:hypothetical protein [Usitatibacter palustris]QJR13333.1 hypothetical protein DSM104440_00116 [Usitatibacter palustris]